ncbi:MAG: hypothetical protein WCC38_04630 [Pseudonocardiaceae bacterium]
MAEARFQVVSAVRCLLVPAPREPAEAAGAWSEPRLEPAVTRAREFSWRFMSANNRSLAKSAQIAPDVESCLEAIRALRVRLPHTVAETSRNGHGQWIWRIRLDDDVIAIAARSYPREIRARMTADAFMLLVATSSASAPVHVMYR